MGVLQELGQPKVYKPYFCPNNNMSTEHISGMRYGQWEFSKNLGSPKCISLISAQYMALRGMGSGVLQELGQPKVIRLISAGLLGQYMALRGMGSGSSPRTWAAQSLISAQYSLISELQ